MTAVPSDTAVLYLVVCAAPPARAIGELVELLRADGWEVYLIPTPVAASWIDVEDLSRRTGRPVRWTTRGPDEPAWLPAADAVVVVPTTFNTINKWAAGINDTLALGVLNETMGLGVPIVVCPYAKDALTSHPAFARSADLLRGAGVHLTDTEAIAPAQAGGPYRWQVITDALARYASRDSRGGSGGSPSPAGE